jgi:hypothetical protein
MLFPNMCRHYVGAKHFFSTNEQQKVCRQPKKIEMQDPTQSLNHMSEYLLLQFMHKAAEEHDTPLISFRFPKDDCFNFVESIWYGRNWPWRA